MSKILIGATGRLSKGHVLDVSRRGLERALRDYDHLLYTKWNPYKNRGWGVWEIRRRPEKKSIKDITEFGGKTYIEIDYVELDIINHVLDVPFLNYDVLTRLKAMDTTNSNQHYFAQNLESRERSHVEAKQAKALESRKLMAREYKREIRDFKEAILSGLNPAEISRFWGNK